MGHYDDCYAEEARERWECEKKALETFFEWYNKVWDYSNRPKNVQIPGFIAEERERIKQKVQSRLYELKDY